MITLGTIRIDSVDGVIRLVLHTDANKYIDELEATGATLEEALANLAVEVEAYR
jgi:hypothetical protein